MSGQGGFVGPYASKTLPSRGRSSFEAGWGQTDDQLFLSLGPMGGLLSGQQVRPVLVSSGLSNEQLSRMWSEVDQDRDGKISMSEFSTIMSRVRLEKSTNTLRPSQSVGNSLSQNWGSGSFSQGRPHSQFATGGVGHSVSLTTLAAGWSMTPEDRRSYNLQFNAHDRSKSGFVSGNEARKIFTKSDLSRDILRQIWELSDIDGDGRLTSDEFAIALHLIEKAKKGVTIPKTLPPELTLTKKTGLGPSIGETFNFEDKRKENFEQGRMELERRRKLLEEQAIKEKEEKERKRREQEERKRLEEEKIQLARQAELERQRQKALAIEREREKMLQQQALKREAEAKEAERRRKEEWAQRRLVEQRQVKDKEEEGLKLVKHRHQEVVDQLTKLDAERDSVHTRLGQQRVVCVTLANTLDSLKQSFPHQRTSLAQLNLGLSTFRNQLSNLEQQRRQLQSALQQRESNEESQEIQQQLEEQLHKVSSQLSELRVTLVQQTSAVEQLRSGKGEKSRKLDNLRQDSSKLQRVVEQLRRQVEEGKRIKQLQEQEQRKILEAKRKETERREAERRGTERREAERREAERREAERREAERREAERREAERREAERREAERREADRREAEKKQRKQVERNESQLQQSMIQPQMLVPVLPSVPLRKPIETSPPPQVVPILPLRKPIESQTQAPARTHPVLGPTPSKQPLSKAQMKKEEDEVKRKVEELQQRRRELQKKQKEEKERQELNEIKFPSGRPRKSAKPALPSKPAGLAKPQVGPKPTNISQLASPPAQPPTTTQGSTTHIYDTPDFANQTKPSAPIVEQHTYDHPPFELQASAIDGSQLGQVATPAGAKDTVIYDTVPFERVDAENIPSPSTADRPQWFRALFTFESSIDGEVSFSVGDLLQQVQGEEREQKGWVMVEKDGEQGWAPASYLEPEEVEPNTHDQQMCLARVLYTWEGSKPNHLSLTKDQVVTVLEQGEGWWSGEIDGKVGWFPHSYVKIIDSSPAISTGLTPQLSEQLSVSLSVSPSGDTDLFQAVYTYTSDAPGDLSFKEGSIIHVTKQEGEWWTGEMNGLQGVFPCNYVKPLDISVTKSPSPTSNMSSFPSLSESILSTSSSPSKVSKKKPLLGKVIVGYQAEKEGQLSLVPGQLVQVLKQESHGWWEGQLHSRGQQRQVGWFPSNRIELLSSQSNTPKAPRSPIPNQTTPSVPTSSLVLALYTYKAESSDELSFHKGSVITVLSKEEGDWWRGELNGNTGLFPSNYVQALDTLKSSEATRWSDYVKPDIVAKVPLEQRKRQEAIFELVYSEKNYLDSLNLVKEVFFDPMISKNVLNDFERDQVVVNWDELITCNTSLCNALFIRLRLSGALVQSIGDVVVEHIPRLLPHIRWCSCQLNACTLLQNKSGDTQFREFEQSCLKDPRTGGLPLSSFLLKPMQRVTKYPLLIMKILEYTPSDHSDRPHLMLALEEAEKLCQKVNEGVQQQENTERLEWLQSHIQLTLNEKLVFNSETNFMGSRHLLHWERLTKLRGNRELLVFLFNDFLLLTKSKSFFPTASEMEPFTNNYFTMYKEPFLLDTIRAKAAQDDQNVFIVTVAKEGKDIPLRAESESARNKWVKVIMDAAVKYARTKKQERRLQRKDSMRQTLLKKAIAKLYVTVVEAADLLASNANGKSDPFCVVKLGDSQELATPIIMGTLNPRWNHAMEFVVTNIEDTIDFTVFDSDMFSPNEFLGNAHLSLSKLREEGPAPWTKRLLLEHVPRGELEIKISMANNKQKPHP